MRVYVINNELFTHIETDRCIMHKVYTIKYYHMGNIKCKQYDKTV